MGRGMPIALCRTQSFSTNQLNERFRNLMASPYSSAPLSCVGCFDFWGRDTNAEACRLAAWVDRFATPPLKLHDQLTAGQPMIFRENIRVPDGQDWRLMDWRAHHPILVFNHGHLLLQLGTSIRKTCKQRHVIVPLTTTDVPGEVRTEIVLPVAGFGHAVLTIGEPSIDYTYEEGGLMSNRKNELFLWWDFVVQGAS